MPPSFIYLETCSSCLSSAPPSKVRWEEQGWLDSFLWGNFDILTRHTIVSRGDTFGWGICCDIHSFCCYNVDPSNQAHHHHLTCRTCRSSLFPRKCICSNRWIRRKYSLLLSRHRLPSRNTLWYNLEQESAQKLGDYSLNACSLSFDHLLCTTAVSSEDMKLENEKFSSLCKDTNRSLLAIRRGKELQSLH